MDDAESLNNYLSRSFEERVIVRASEYKHESGGHCISAALGHGHSSESIYLHHHFHERLGGVRADSHSRSAIICVPIPDNGTIPKILNDIFNIEAVSQLIGNALGIGEKSTPEIDVPIDDEHAFFETEIAEADEVGENNHQEIRATGVLEFFDLVPEWLSSQLDASIIPFEDRWLTTLDVHLKSNGHIIVNPAPRGMSLDPKTNHRIIVTSFMKGIINTNDNVPYPLEVELDYDPILGALDDEIEIPGEGKNTIIAINEIYDSGDTVVEQIETLKSAGKAQEDFMDAVASEIIADEDDETVHKAVTDDEFFEVELTLSGHRKDEIELILEQQVVVYVDPKHLDYARAQLMENPVFLTADAMFSFGLYNPGVPPEGQENTEKNDHLQLYLNIKNGADEILKKSIILHGGPLMRLAKLKLPNHLPKHKPTLLGDNTSTNGVTLAGSEED